MRTICLLTLAIFLPAFACAADSPILTTYTIYNDTIYPTTTVNSGLATTTTIDIAFSEQVKASIKIISASGTVIKTLYSSSSVTNPTPKIWDGMNTSGTLVDDGTYTILISATSTATNITMSDSSKTIIVASFSDPDDPTTPPDDSPPETTTALSTNSNNNSPPEYIPIPTLHIVSNENRTISSGADVSFTAIIYDGNGNKRDDALVTWSFGDGMKRTGASVFHAYYDPGEYIVVVHATTSDGGDMLVENIVTVKDASIKIASVSARGIALTNNSSRTLDLSLWRLSAGGKEFKIPTDTQILSGRTILFPSQIIQLPISNTASLLYPSGEVAATYPANTASSQMNASMQPSPAIVGYKQTQTIEPIISTKTNIQKNDEAVLAPAAATELAAAGAALPDSPKTSPQTGATGIFKSSWTLGFIGVVALAASAFIFL